MAHNVDLMVVGTSDGVSADELTQRLVNEFKQPAEAFTALVAAACSGASAYAAQSEVSLDTAVEGQMQLEKLGVVCKVLMDGKELGTEPAANVENIESLSTDPVTQVEPNQVTDESAKVPEDAEDTVIAAQADELVVEPEETADSLDLAEITLAEVSDTPADNASVELSDSSEDSVDDMELSFNDELGSLDEEVNRTREKLKAQKEQAKLSIEASKKDPLKIEEDAEVQQQPEADIVAAPDDNAEPAEDDVAADLDKQTEVGADLELSLAVDDSAPLTKPKAKSNKVVADDGGLTLSLDDDAPLTKPAPKSTQPKPQALDVTLSIDDELQLPNLDSGSAPSGSVVAEAEARDTSKEQIEETSPPTVEPEAEKTGTPDNEDSEPEGKPEKNSDDSEKESPSANVATETASGAKDAEELTEAVVQPANPINNLIDDLSANTGGLVLSGQTVEAKEEQTAVESVAEAMQDSDGTDEQVVLPEPVELAPGAVDSFGTELEDEVKVLFEEDENRAKRKKLMVTAAAATVVLGALGGGAAFFMSGQMPVQNVVPTVATNTNALKESQLLEAREEGSLNAAIKRSSGQNNPDNYSTEELIAYLADGLGTSASTELKNYVNSDGEYQPADQSSVPRMGAAIPADSNSVLWLKNRVAHPADKYFDEWSKREVDLSAYLELQQRLIDVGDLEIASEISKSTKDKLFSVMSQQRLARSYFALGHKEKALDAMELASRGTYSIASEYERTIAIADYGLTEKVMGLEEDSLDSFLKASILARSLNKPESKTVALSAIAEYYQKVNRIEDMEEYLELAMEAAYGLPVNTAARDLAIRHVALTEVRLGLSKQATEHTNLIVDPFAAVSALHGIALELERTGDQTNARLTLNMAYRAGSQIKNSEKREKLLEKIKLAGG